MYPVYICFTSQFVVWPFTCSFAQIWISISQWCLLWINTVPPDGFYGKKYSKCYSMKVDFIDPLHFDPLVHQAFIGTKLTKESTIIIVHANFHWFLLLVLWKRVRVMVFNATFNDISYIMGVSFIGEGNRSIQSKPLTNFIT